MLNCDQIEDQITRHDPDPKMENFPSRLNKVEGVALNLVPVPLGNVFGRFFILRSLD